MRQASSTLLPMFCLCCCCSSVISQNQTILPRFVFLPRAPICDPTIWNCISDEGPENQGYGGPCDSYQSRLKNFIEYAKKQDDFINEEEGKGESAFLSRLRKRSCKSSQFLECREKQIKGSGLDAEGSSSSSVNAETHFCACADPEADIPQDNAYFDKVLQKCVYKVHTKCTNFLVARHLRRFNGSSDLEKSDPEIKNYSVASRLIDARPQPGLYPCVPNGHCNSRVRTKQFPKGKPTTTPPPGLLSPRSQSSQIFSTGVGSDDYNEHYAASFGEKGYDHTTNQCVCSTGYFPTEQGECEPLERVEWSRRQIYALLTISLAFGTFLGLTLCVEDEDLYYGKGLGYR